MRHVLDIELPFVDGEPDVEPLEESAVHEVDDDLLLEWELDNEDLDEGDVDDDVLNALIEDMEEGGVRDTAGE